MAKEIPDLVAEARAGTGKGAARQARREGKVPGIVYGDHKDPIAIQFDFNKLLGITIERLESDCVTARIAMRPALPRRGPWCLPWIAWYPLIFRVLNTWKRRWFFGMVNG